MSQKHLPKNIAFEALKFLDLPIPKYAERLVVDGSIGGPSYWGRDCHWVFQKHGLSSVFISFFFKEILIGSQSFKLPESITKYSYNQIIRCIIKNVNPKKIIVVSRELGSKLCDLSYERILVETGFGEEDLLEFEKTNGKNSKEIIERALLEVLFRNNTYPWDSLAHLICASEAVKCSNTNVLWSEEAANRAKRVFKSSQIISQLPSFHIPVIIPAKAKENLKIIATTGSHIISNKTIHFLSIDILCKLLPSFPSLRLVLISRYPDRLEQFASKNITIERLRDKHSSIERYRHCDVFFRVQNDSSLPMSCLEAMALEKVVIMNKAVKNASSQLKHEDNVLLTPFMNSLALQNVLEYLVKNRTRLSEIGKSARRFALNNCDIEKNLRNLNLL